MEILFYMIFFFVILIPLILGIIIPIYKNHSNVTGNIINYDSTMRKFVYKINLSYQQAVDLLNTKNVVDELSCTFDFDKAIIRFSEYGSHRDYYFQVQEFDGFSVLKLKSAKHFRDEIIAVSDKNNIFGIVKSLAGSTFVESLCDEFVSSLLEFAAFCFHYGYVEGASHVKMLTFKEIMLLNCGILRKEDVAASATARSVNRKYINSLPCVPYIDSDGTAYWE